MGDAREYRKPPWSLPAIASTVVGLPFCLPIGIVGVVLGLVGIVQTRSGRRRGRKPALWGLGLGVVSLWLTFHPFGYAYCQPPVLPADRELQRFFDEIAGGRYDSAMKQRIVVDTSMEEFTGWADELNKEMGPATVVVAMVRLHFIDPSNTYLVHFRKGGWRRVMTGAPDWDFAHDKGLVLVETAGVLKTPAQWAREKRDRELGF